MQIQSRRFKRTPKWNERKANSKLTRSDLLEIKARLEEIRKYYDAKDLRDLAAKYGVCENTILNIKNGKTFKWFFEEETRLRKVFLRR